jgi:FtsH-binding integral membrane protein
VCFGFLQGIAVSPLIASVAQVDPSIPLKAFLLTCVVFVCFSLSALLCADRRYLYLYGICTSMLLGLCILSILNIFVQSPFVQNLWLYGGLLLFSLVRKKKRYKNED